jgi:hypothetical protein
MGFKKYRKKPVVIEAFQFFAKDTPHPDCVKYHRNTQQLQFGEHYYYIKTLEGDMTVSDGDYIIKGVKGEFYPCKPDIFSETYEELVRTSLAQSEESTNIKDYYETNRSYCSKCVSLGSMKCITCKNKDIVSIDPNNTIPPERFAPKTPKR